MTALAAATSPAVSADHDLLARAEAAYTGALADPARYTKIAAACVEEARTAGQTEALVVALRALAWGRHAVLDNAGAKRLLDDAARLARAHGLAVRLGEVLVSRAVASHELGRLRAARQDLERAATLLLPEGAVEVLLQLAVLDHNVGRIQEAARRYREVLDTPGCPEEIWVKAVNNLSVALTLLGRPADALTVLVGAAPRAQRLGPWFVAIVANSTAWSTMHAGGLTDGLARFEESGRLYALAGLPLGEHHLDYADCLVDLRLLPEAARITELAAAEFEQHGAGLMAAEAHLRAARLSLLTAEPAATLDRAERLLPLLQRQRRTAPLARLRLAAVEARRALGQGADDDRLVSARAAAALARLGMPISAVEGYLLAGRLELEAGRRRQGLARLARAQQLATGATVLVRLQGRLAGALAAQAQGYGQEVLQHCRAGLADLSAHRVALPSIELRVLASGHGIELGRLGLRAVVAAGSAPEVLDWMERTRAAALLAVEPARPGVAQDDLATLRQVHVELRDARRTLGREPRELVARATAVETRIRRATWAAGAAADRTALAPVRVGELRRLLAGARLVAYATLDRRLVAVVVGGRRPQFLDVADAAAVDTERRAALFALRRAGMSRSASAVASLRVGCARLRQLLLDPLRLPGDGPIVVVPGAALYGLPWSALHDGPVSLAPSATMWARTRRPVEPQDADVEGAADDGARRTVLVAGPDLAGATEEVEALAAVHAGAEIPAEILRPPASTAAAVTAAIAGASLAHLACHGVLRADSPTFSSLLLSDGPLTVHELTTTARPADRIVLAACDAGADVAVGGVEVIGFVSALMARGTRALIAPVLPVPDAATVTLMRGVHTALAAGDDAATALWSARRALDPDDPTDLAVGSAFTAFGAA